MVKSWTSREARAAFNALAAAAASMFLGELGLTSVRFLDAPSGRSDSN